MAMELLKVVDSYGRHIGMDYPLLMGKIAALNLLFNH